MERPETYNLARDLDDDELNAIAGRVLEDYRYDLESRKDWEDKHARYVELFHQMDHPKNPPWEGSSDESIPLLTEACVQFQSRAYTAFFPNDRIITAVPVGRTDAAARDRAERVRNHLTYQLIEKSDRYKEDKDSLLLSVAVHGSFFTKTYHHDGENIVENVRAEDLVVPYGVGPRRIEDVERKTHVIWKPVNWTKIQEQAGFFVAAGEPYDGGEKSEIRAAQEKADGVADPIYQSDDRPCKLLEQHRLLDLDDDGVSEPYIVTVDVQSQKVLRIQVGYEVDDAGRPVNDKKPVEYFTHYGFLPNPDGFYCYGMGHLLGEINSAINKLLRETVDAGELANAGNMSGFISEQLGVPGEEVEIQLGKFRKVRQSFEDIRRGIFQFTFPGPHASLYQVMNDLKADGHRLATVTEAITGQTDKVIQPTALLALIEQSLQLFSSIYERMFRAWTSELRKIYRLNRKYFVGPEFFAVNDIHQGLRQHTATAQDYADDLQIRPLADPRMATDQQRYAKADAEWQFLVNNPLVINSPVHLRAASARYLETIGTEGIDEVLPKIEAPQQPRVDDPRAENMGALFPVPQVPKVFPDQDHLAHIKEHEAFIAGPYGSRLTPEGLKAIQDHVQTHVTFMYGANETGLLDGQGAATAMGQPPGNAGVPGGASGAVQPGPGLGGGLDMGQRQPPERAA